MLFIEQQTTTLQLDMVQVPQRAPTSPTIRAVIILTWIYYNDSIGAWQEQTQTFKFRVEE